MNSTLPLRLLIIIVIIEIAFVVLTGTLDKGYLDRCGIVFM